MFNLKNGTIGAIFQVVQAQESTTEFVYADCSFPFLPGCSQTPKSWDYYAEVFVGLHVLLHGAAGSRGETHRSFGSFRLDTKLNLQRSLSPKDGQAHWTPIGRRLDAEQ